jgi:hypothetical protein
MGFTEYVQRLSKLVKNTLSQSLFTRKNWGKFISERYGFCLD